MGCIDCTYYRGNDFGAHIGYYSLQVSNLKNLFINAVEPIKSHFEQLKLNIESNNIKNIIQPGGSIRDNESIIFCDKHKMTMIFTGTRHFRH